MISIKLDKVTVNKNKVLFDYKIPDQIKKFFSDSMNFYYEYPEEIDLSTVPISILTVPFVMNMMPFIWISGSELLVDSLDETFFYSLNDVLEGFKKVHPKVEFSGKLSVEQLEKNEYKVDNNSKAMLFSGGVDAVSTLVTHMDEKPMLINIWGADIHPDDNNNHLLIKKDLENFSNEVGLPFFFIRSSIRWCFDERYLSEYYRDMIHDTWWHGMQHGVGLLSLLAPYDYVKKIAINYIASSYTEQDVGVVKCISYPFVDSMLKIASTICIHDGFEKRRIDKVENIVLYLKEMDKKLSLKVCFRPQNGENCCKCEKCLRTMSAILIMNGEVRNYGFNPDYRIVEKYIKKFCDKTIFDESVLMFWRDIRDYVIEHGTKNSNMGWLSSYKFNTFKPKWYTPIETQIRIKLGKVRHWLFNVRRER